MDVEIKIQYYENGNPRWHNSYLNGFYHGLQQYYYENNQLSYEYLMKHGFCCGIGKNWNKSGERNSLEQFKNSFSNGLFIQFNY